MTSLDHSGERRPSGAAGSPLAIELRLEGLHDGILVTGEIDATHYVVTVLGWLHVVWDIRGPSDEVLAEGRQ